jgi:hypothetical protein
LRSFARMALRLQIELPMTNLIKLKRLSFSAVLLVALFALPASADTFSLGLGNPDISGYPGPYAEVAVNLVGSTASVTFSALDSSPWHYLFGDGGSVALNVNGSFVVSGMTWSGQPQLNPSAPSLFVDGAGNEDGWGTFNLRISNNGGFKEAVKTLSFTLTGGSWSSASDVLTANANGAKAAAHIFVANSDWTNTGVTGFAADGGTNRVPDGGTTALLLGLALGAGGVVLRRKA